jgi:hypothetical protein
MLLNTIKTFGRHPLQLDGHLQKQQDSHEVSATGVLTRRAAAGAPRKFPVG